MWQMPPLFCLRNTAGHVEDLILVLCSGITPGREITNLMYKYHSFVLNSILTGTHCFNLWMSFYQPGNAFFFFFQCISKKISKNRSQYCMNSNSINFFSSNAIYSY